MASEPEGPTKWDTLLICGTLLAGAVWLLLTLIWR